MSAVVALAQKDTIVVASDKRMTLTGYDAEGRAVERSHADGISKLVSIRHDLLLAGKPSRRWEDLFYGTAWPTWCPF